MKRIAWILVGVMAVLLAACAPSTPAAAPTGAAPSAQNTGSKRVTVGLVQIGTDNPFWVAQVDGGNEASRRYGFDLKVTSGQGDVNKQVAAFEDLINQKVDVIAVNAIDTKAYGPAMAKAKAANIPVVCLFSLIDGCVTTIGFDETYTGRTVGEYAVELLKQKMGSAKGKVAILEGLLGQDINQFRGGAFEEVLKQYPDIQVVAKEPTNWDAKKAADITQNWLTAYPDLTMIYGLSDSLTVPASNVIKRAGKTEQILLVSVDGTEPGLAAVKDGSVKSTFAYAPQYDGFWNVYVPYLVTRGVTFPANVKLTGAIVTQTNIDALIKMADDQAKNIKQFPFEMPLTSIVEQYTVQYGKK